MSLSAFEAELVQSVLLIGRTAVGAIQLTEAEAMRIMFAVLPVIERAMPTAMLNEDARMLDAKAMWERLRAEANAPPKEDTRPTPRSWH